MNDVVETGAITRKLVRPEDVTPSERATKALQRPAADLVLEALQELHSAPLHQQAQRLIGRFSEVMGDTAISLWKYNSQSHLLESVVLTNHSLLEPQIDAMVHELSAVTIGENSIVGNFALPVLAQNIDQTIFENRGDGIELWHIPAVRFLPESMRQTSGQLSAQLGYSPMKMLLLGWQSHENLPKRLILQCCREREKNEFSQEEMKACELVLRLLVLHQLAFE